MHKVAKESVQFSWCPHARLPTLVHTPTHPPHAQARKQHDPTFCLGWFVGYRFSSFAFEGCGVKKPAPEGAVGHARGLFLFSLFVWLSWSLFWICLCFSFLNLVVSSLKEK